MLAHPRDFVGITRENQEALLGFVCDSVEEALRVISFGESAHMPVVLHVDVGDIDDLIDPATTSTEQVVLHTHVPKSRDIAQAMTAQGVRSFTLGPESDLRVLQELSHRGAWLEGAMGEYEDMQHGVYVPLNPVPGAFSGRGYVSLGMNPAKSKKHHLVAHSDMDLAPEHLVHVANGPFSKVILPARSIVSGLVDKLVEVSCNDTVHYNQ